MNEVTARVRDVFDDWARTGRADGMATSHGPAARAGFAHLGLPVGGRYLDVGCGNGYTLRWAAEAVGPTGEAVGMDVAPTMVAHARDLCADLPQVRAVEGAWPAHDLAAESVDGVFSMEVFYYLPDLADSLRAVRDVLRPGGRFACVVDHYEENAASHGWAADLDVYMRRLDMAGWRAAFDAAGLTVVEQTQVRQTPSAGETPGWKHTVGSLLTVGVR